MPELTSPQRLYPKHLTRAEAASYLGVERRTLDNWSHAGRGPRFYKIGRAARYRVDDLEAWLQSRAVDCDQAEAAQGKGASM